MILFREMKDPAVPGSVPRFPRWQVEYYDDENDRAFPQGLLWVGDYRAAPAMPCVLVLFVLVPDDERRKGIGGKLLRAAYARWPELELTGFIGPEGEALLSSFERWKVAGERYP